MKTKIYSALIQGIKSRLIEVEVDISEGKKPMRIIGLTPGSTHPTRHRVAMALKSTEIQLEDRSIFVNIAPANIRKDSSHFDLAIAMATLQALGKTNATEKFLDETLFAGELSIHGDTKSINGSLVIASEAKLQGKKRLIVSLENAQEAGLIEGIEVIGIKSIESLIKYIDNHSTIKPTKTSIEKVKTETDTIDFDDVKGQEYAKRALQIAAAGRHNLLFSGPPGSGKTMLAKRIITIMPPMSFDEVIDTTKIYSITGKLNGQSLITQRPFRMPHHTTPRASIIGGGAYHPVPGEISLANNGILFLDELTEFDREVLESLREPLENGFVNISRVQTQTTYPSQFLLIAAYNPCPCGFFGDLNKKCTCSPSMVKHYQSKISGPLLDRIDIRIGVRAIEYQEAIAKKEKTTMSSENLRIGVQNALNIQEHRFGTKNKTNAMMNAQEVERFCILTLEAEEIIKKAFIKLNLSMRAYHKVLKLSRTIADICNSNLIDVQHITEALMYKFETT